ncbi:glutamine synthetase [Pseudonocardia bannensis]|uniref:Glutamine synthetase n=1 Tax=Pseudonocardia bannensis TaxID=630973 RepID=A0A848DKH4_9PSEU|nr:glutamine synthetase [Pseudonocardia bannensis]NMH93065.1 glutamine synthetase [Pseudonocardia bannensis]
MQHQERVERAAQGTRHAERLAAADVVAVALTWVDNGGITRVKAVPTAALPRAAAWGVGATPLFDFFLPDDSITDGRWSAGPTGDLRLLPDLDRLVVLAAQPGWAWAPVDRWTQEGEPHPQCSRATAGRLAGRLAGMGITVRMAFEIEWVLAPAEGPGPGPGFVPAMSGPAYGMARLVERSDYAADLLRALAAQEVEVLQFHPEYAPGQLEVSVAPESPVAAADTAVLVRTTIRAVAQRHGLRVSFAPAVVAGEVGNGGHVHLSIHRAGRNLMSGGDGPCGLAKEGEGFTAGILDRLPALLAVAAPSVASYLRLVPSHWAGVYACWGPENREAAVRLVTGSVGEQAAAANVEVKCMDQSANPYLVVAGLLACGLAGIEQGARLRDPVYIDPARWSAGERSTRGVVRLPQRLEDAVAAFRRESVLAEAFGPELADTIAAVRDAEIARFAGVAPGDVVAASRWTH